MNKETNNKKLTRTNKQQHKKKTPHHTMVSKRRRKVRTDTRALCDIRGVLRQEFHQRILFHNTFIRIKGLSCGKTTFYKVFPHTILADIVIAYAAALEHQLFGFVAYIARNNCGAHVCFHLRN